MEVYIRRPSVDLYPGVKVTKDTVLEYKNENVEQKVENLVMHSVTKVKGEGYESTLDTTIYLKEGDVLVYEEEGRGYGRPDKHQGFGVSKCLLSMTIYPSM